MPRGDMWPILGEYSADVIVAALESAPGVTGLRPGELDSGGPVVRFDLAGGRAGGVGCFRQGEYLVTIGWKFADGGALPDGRTTFGLKSGTVTAAALIPAEVAALSEQVRPRLRAVPEPRRGSGPVRCGVAWCRGHRDRCLFSRQHTWVRPWYENGVMQRTAETYHCWTCGGICTAEEPQTDKETMTC